MVVFKRKQVVIAIIFCMVLAAGYINWAYQEDGNSAAVSNEHSEYLGEAEMVNASAEKSKIQQATEAKTTARNKAMELLNEIVNNPSTNEDSKTSALSQLAQMADNMEKEGICEGILNSKGMGEMVVYIADGVATITVNTDAELTSEQVAKITDVILSNTKVAAENIKINRVS
ncbi:MAG: SpoIIIAH-like family protein [Clostridia bacterium]|nr:SpoIIIAH-like family protein [Clostridia bacterium]